MPADISGGSAKISIVVPSLNQCEFITATLSSLIRQRDVSGEDLEIIVIDGGSSDGTLDVLGRFDKHLSYWISEPDSGQTDALRKGFERATGAIQGWLCADDLLTPNTIREVLKFFASHPDADFVYGDAIWIDRNGRPSQLKREIPFNWFIWLHDHNYIPQPASFWRRKLYNAVGGLDKTFDLAMDADLFARFALRSRPHHVSRIWALMRRYPAQKNQRLRNRSNAEDRVIRQRLGTTSSAPVARFLAAKALRIAWKLVIGAYLPKSITRQIWSRAVS